MYRQGWKRGMYYTSFNLKVKQKIETEKNKKIKN
jgi:hypothetical protein